MGMYQLVTYLQYYYNKWIITPEPNMIMLVVNIR